MQYLKSDVFENLFVYELGRYSTEYGAGRAPHDQLLNGRIWDACQKYGIKNMLTLFCYGATKTLWFSTVARDREGQIAWAEKIAEEYAKVGDIRLMSDLTLADIKTMELVWAQAASRLNTYAANKIPNPKLPDPKQPIPKPKPVEDREKKEEEEGNQGEPEKPVDPVKEEPKQVEEPKKSGTMKIIGVIAGMLAAIVAWLPIPAAISSLLKIILNAIASIFK
jgi:hypothetical protein